MRPLPFDDDDQPGDEADAAAARWTSTSETLRVRPPLHDPAGAADFDEPQAGESWRRPSA